MENKEIYGLMTNNQTIENFLQNLKYENEEDLGEYIFSYVIDKREEMLGKYNEESDKAPENRTNEAIAIDMEFYITEYIREIVRKYEMELDFELDDLNYDTMFNHLMQNIPEDFDLEIMHLVENMKFEYSKK